jgi:tetratricopeptide (TPR) repeat protein
MRRRFSDRASLCSYGLALILSAAALPCWARPGDTANLGRLCEAAAQDPDRGIAACTRLLKPGRTGIDIAAVYTNRGIGQAAKKAYDNAIADFNEAIREDAQNVSAHANRGLAYWSKGESDLAIADFSSATSLNPAFAFGYMARGTLLSDRGNLDLAIGDFDKAIANDADFAAAYRGRGIAHYRKSEFALAIADFDQLVRLDPKNPDSYDSRAQALLAQGVLDKALDDYSSAIKLRPDSARLLASRGEVYRLKGEFKKALADHNEAIRLDPKSPDAYNDRGLAWISKGSVDRAIADFDAAIAINPSYGYAYLNRGEAFRFKGDFKRSLADFDKAISILGGSSTELCRRGDTLRHTGNFDRAVSDYEEALRVSPTAICAFVGKALVAEAKGDLAAARTEFQRAASIPAERDPEPTVARETQALAVTRLALLKSAEPEQTTRAIAPQDLLKQDQQKETTAIATAKALSMIEGGKRVALVIGNAAYFNLDVLPNSRRDAVSIADALRRLGFQSVSLQRDVTREELANALRDFSRLANTADWAVVYYAGHSVQVAGENYLVPIDATLAKETDMRREAVLLDQVLASVNAAKKLRLVMIDAGRDNLFATTSAQAGKNTGLAAVEPDGATLVVYGAKAGQFALDSDDRGNSPFVSAFLRSLETPRVEIRKLFDQVRDDVKKATNNRQEPFTYGSVAGREDYFMVMR